MFLLIQILQIFVSKQVKVYQVFFSNFVDFYKISYEM